VSAGKRRRPSILGLYAMRHRLMSQLPPNSHAHYGAIAVLRPQIVTAQAALRQSCDALWMACLVADGVDQDEAARIVREARSRGGGWPAGTDERLC